MSARNLSEPSDVWITLDLAVYLVVLSMESGPGYLQSSDFRSILVKQGRLERGFSVAYLQYLRSSEYQHAEARIGQWLATGQLAAFGEVTAPIAGENKHRQIDPIEWATLKLSGLDDLGRRPYSRVRVRRESIEKLCRPGESKRATQSSDSRSDFDKAKALEILDRHQGWIPRSQTQAARELRFAYEKEIDEHKVPAHGTCVDWVRQWRSKRRSAGLTS